MFTARRLFSLAAFLSIFLAHTTAKCPRNCICDQLRKVADCTRAGLTSIPWNLPDPVGLKQLILRGNRISNIISEIVSYSHLELLDLSDNSLRSIDPGVFDALAELKYLYLHNNKLTSLNVNNFKGLVSLDELDLSYNQIRQLEDGSFSDLPTLTVLNLMGNELDFVPGQVFSGLTSLRSLNLGDNRFKSVPVSSMKATSSLTELNLDFNNIEILGLFQLTAVVETLENLSIEGNKIVDVIWQSEHREIATSPILSTLSLKSNKLRTVPIESIKNLQNLISLDMSGNLFTTFEADSLKGLESLEHLYLNTLSGLEKVSDFAFAELRRLRTVEMHSNRNLAYIGAKTFLGLPMLTSVDLHANNLRTLNPSTFDWLNLQSVDLRFNPWNCDCDLKWLHSLLLDVEVNASNFHSEDLFCSSPEELSTLRIKDVEGPLFKCHKAGSDHNFEDRIMLGIFISFTFLLIVILFVLLYRYKYLKCFPTRLRQVPLVNYHANVNPLMNGHCHAIPCQNQNEEEIQIAANEVHADDDV